MAYLLDANVYIEAHQRYYGMDLCPGFWRWLEEAGASGNLVRDFGAEIEFPTAKEDTIPVVFKVSKASR